MDLKTDPEATLTADPHEAPAGGLFARARARFARFRKTRPFWGSLVLAFGGYLILDPVVGGSASFFVQTGLPAFLPVFLGGGVIIAALVCMFAPSQRMFPAVFAALLSVASLPLANLGGFVIGMTLGIIGAGLCFAWTPYSDKQLAKMTARDERRVARRAAKSSN